MEEEFYWKHVETLRFCLLLTGDFHRKLLVPKKFADNAKLTVLQPKLSLRGPSGDSWDVSLTTGADGLYLEHGWEEFVKAYSLEESNLLLFMYDRQSSLDIKIFDGEYCEKVAAYFVKKGDNVVQQKRASSEISQENAKKARVDVVTEPTPEKPQLYTLQCRTPKQTSTRQKPVMKAPSRSLKELQGLYSYEAGAISSSKKAVLRSRKLTWSKKNKSSTGEFNASNRRPVTEKEKDHALRMACDILTERSFIVAMQPSYCSKSFFLPIPSIWATTYLSSRNYSVILRVGEKAWPARFNFRECALASSGWKQFAVENHLEESDVCLFKLTCMDRDFAMLDVTIVRVVVKVTDRPSSAIGPVTKDFHRVYTRSKKSRNGQ